MDSGADNWEQRPYLPIYDDANWFADGKRATLPEDFTPQHFSSIKPWNLSRRTEDGRPFFAYILSRPCIYRSAGAQGIYGALSRSLRRWLGRPPGAGWRARAAELGVIPRDVPMVRMESTADWEALDGERRRFEAKRMAVYAGMLEAMDFHLGRLARI